MVIRDHSSNSLGKMFCSLRYGATQCHTHIHTHIRHNVLHTHVPHVPHTYFWMPLNIYMPHIHIVQLEYLWIKKKPALSSSWLGSCTVFLIKKNLAFLLKFYHETKMGKSLRYIYQYAFTRHTHTHIVQKNRRLYFYHTVFGVSFTQRLFIHMPFILFYTLEWSVT